MRTIELIISETGRGSLKDEPSLFNKICECFETKEELKQYLIDRYGKMPNGKHKVYVDKKSGGAEQVGFLHSFWNKDWSHNTPSWYQTDWIEFFEQDTNRKYFKL